MDGEEVRAIRKRARLTQAQLAVRLGVARNTVARWEMGVVGVSGPAAQLLQVIDQGDAVVLEKPPPAIRRRLAGRSTKGRAPKAHRDELAPEELQKPVSDVATAIANADRAAKDVELSPQSKIILERLIAHDAKPPPPWKQAQKVKLDRAAIRRHRQT